MKILIAMNNRIYSKYLSYRLADRGDEVCCVYDGIQALTALKKDRWSLVVIGILLKYQNGLEVISEYNRYKETLPAEEANETKVVIVTRVRNERARRSARELGVSAYYTLPVNTSQLIKGFVALLFFFYYAFTPVQAQEKTKGLLGVGCNYYIEHVSEPASLNWQVVSVEALAGISSSSPFRAVFIPRLNFAQRTGNGVSFFDHTALQSQLETYLYFSKRVSLTLSYGYSGSMRYPSHQASTELLYSLNRGWGITGRLQLTRWSKTALAYQVGVEKYVGPFWVTLKPMLVMQDGDGFIAVRGSLRYYYSDHTDNYLHFGAYYGNSPEYANYLPDLETLLSLGSYGGYLNWQHRLSKHLLLRLGISYRREEYRSDQWRNVWGANTGLTYKF